MFESATLTLFKDGVPLSAFFLSPDKDTTIGRSPDCDIVINDSGCSRYHAAIKRRENGWELTDHESRNGSAINGDVFSGTKILKDGDRIQLAHTQLI
ncbi:MAG: FHA domain-containing protein, partial [Thermoguttaceae bacterium]|nr:FHA domain-containing protein [Thermoguttaceae bacterium]